MSEKRAYCGYDCTTCLGWIAWQIKDLNVQNEYLKKNAGVIPCAGCHATENVCDKTCNSCSIRLCGLQKNEDTCELCESYPCKLHQTDKTL